MNNKLSVAEIEPVLDTAKQMFHLFVHSRKMIFGCRTEVFIKVAVVVRCMLIEVLVIEKLRRRGGNIFEA